MPNKENYKPLAIALAAPLASPEQVTASFPLVFSIVILLAVLFVAMPEYFLSKLRQGVMFGSRPVDDKENTLADWKAGLIHYLVGGLAVPSLFSLFMVFFMKYFYLNFISVLMAKIGFPLNAANIEYLTMRTDATLYAIMVLMYYAGIWLGVLFSIIVLNRFRLGNRRWIIIWSTVFMLSGFLFLNAFAQNAIPRFLPYDNYNELDQILRVVFFYIVSHKYIYLLLRKPGDRKLIGGFR